MFGPFKKDRALGVAREKRRFDLGLENSSGSGFLMTLIGLMTFLAMMALAASFALTALSDRWSSGLENKVTIEIPAETDNGEKRGRDEIREIAETVVQILQSQSFVEGSEILSDADIAELVRPWLGDGLPLNEIPLPGLISVDLAEGGASALPALGSRLRNIAGNINIDTHEEWLGDILRFTGALQFAALLLGGAIGLTTLIAVTGAVRSQMAIHRDEIEILHLMGATDLYIAKQFQHHSLLLSLKGSTAGAVICGAALFAIGWASGRMDVNLLPDFRMTADHLVFLGALPLLASVIAMTAARQTVLRVLSQLP